MKKSELTFTGQTYRLTPNYWGETGIMIDEDEVTSLMCETFGESTTADEDENDPPEDVEIATDAAGAFFCVIPESHGRSHGTRNTIYPATYRLCENPAEATQGLASIFGNRWQEFDSD